jgi:hypothetical protein
MLEEELKAIGNRFLSASAASIEGQLREIRQFVEKGKRQIPAPPIKNWEDLLCQKERDSKATCIKLSR